MWLDEFYHSLDPVAFSLGPLEVRWYGLAYLAGFICAGAVMRAYAKRWKLDLTVDDIYAVILGIAFGVIVGGRIGYVLFYGAGYYLAHPLEIILPPWLGMSFHGGLAGAVVGCMIVVRSLRLDFLTLADLVACGAPLGLFFGRCANFVNGELWGKETDLPWGVMFEAGGAVYRHPSQLYEALLEGLVIFLVLFALARRLPARPQGTFLGTFLALYGIFRFAVEFVRVPDAQLGYLFGFITMGQLLSLPLVVAGIAVLVWSRHTRRTQAGHLG